MKNVPPNFSNFFVQFFGTCSISGNPEILKKLNVSISTSNKMNFNTESINIELDHNQKNNSILSVELNTDLLDKEQIINDSTLIQVRYIENAD